MKNRTSTDNVRLLLHLMWLSQSQNVPVTTISLDAEKAFDRVEWQFLFSTLSHFGLNSNFIKWIKMLYKEPKAAVMTNGIISPFFNLTPRNSTGMLTEPIVVHHLFGGSGSVCLSTSWNKRSTGRRQRTKIIIIR